MPRIVYEANGRSAQQLERMADELDLSKVKALQLAVSVLAKLSDEIGRGTELVLRQQNGKEIELWLPHLKKSDEASVPEEKNSEQLRETSSSRTRPSRQTSRPGKHG